MGGWPRGHVMGGGGGGSGSGWVAWQAKMFRRVSSRAFGSLTCASATAVRLQSLTRVCQEAVAFVPVPYACSVLHGQSRCEREYSCLPHAELVGPARVTGFQSATAAGTIGLCTRKRRMRAFVPQLSTL